MSLLLALVGGGGPVTHDTTGALIAQSATVAGASAHVALHPTSGALVSQSAIIAGAAGRVVVHQTSGALVAQDAAIAGTSAHIALHGTTGALLADAAVINGASVKSVEHATNGVLVAQAAEISGAVSGTAHPLPDAGHPFIAYGALVTGNYQPRTAKEHRTVGNLAAQSARIAAFSTRSSFKRTRTARSEESVMFF